MGPSLIFCCKQIKFWPASMWKLESLKYWRFWVIFVEIFGLRFQHLWKTDRNQISMAFNIVNKSLKNIQLYIKYFHGNLIPNYYECVINHLSRKISRLVFENGRNRKQCSLLFKICKMFDVLSAESLWHSKFIFWFVSEFGIERLFIEV